MAEYYAKDRESLAGPVFAAAVHLSNTLWITGGQSDRNGDQISSRTMTLNTLSTDRSLDWNFEAAIDLPLPMSGHCAVLLERSGKVFLAGVRRTMYH